MKPVEIKSFRLKLHSKDYAIARASWFGDYNDVSTFTDKYLSNSENNDSGWVNKEYDDLLHDAEYDKDPGPPHRLGTLSRAEQILCEEAPIIPVYYYTSAYLFRDNVRGIPLNPRMMLNSSPYTLRNSGSGTPLECRHEVRNRSKGLAC